MNLAQQPGAIESMKGRTVFDHDYLIVGSGFGGSASAVRLAE